MIVGASRRSGDARAGPYLLKVLCSLCYAIGCTTALAGHIAQLVVEHATTEAVLSLVLLHIGIAILCSGAEYINRGCRVLFNNGIVVINGTIRCYCDYRRKIKNKMGPMQLFAPLAPNSFSMVVMVPSSLQKKDTKLSVLKENEKQTQRPLPPPEPNTIRLVLARFCFRALLVSYYVFRFRGLNGVGARVFLSLFCPSNIAKTVTSIKRTGKATEWRKLIFVIFLTVNLIIGSPCNQRLLDHHLRQRSSSPASSFEWCEGMCGPYGVGLRASRCSEPPPRGRWTA